MSKRTKRMRIGPAYQTRWISEPEGLGLATIPHNPRCLAQRMEGLSHFGEPSFLTRQIDLPLTPKDARELFDFPKSMPGDYTTTESGVVTLHRADGFAVMHLPESDWKALGEGE